MSSNLAALEQELLEALRELEKLRADKGFLKIGRRVNKADLAIDRY
jgi:hypothetical protein